MEIYPDLNSVKKNSNSVITVGTFDGVHLGHQFILEELKKRAIRRGAASTLVTFKPHPQLVLNSKKPDLKILTTLEEKIEILSQIQLDRVIIIPFTREFAKTPSHDFVRTILFDTIGFKEIVVGHDHAFGKDREGDMSTLRAMADELGFSVDNLPGYQLDGTVISSTKIRNLIAGDNIKEANKLLARNYFFSGKVVPGDGRGARQNFPTANLQIDSEDKLIPPDGVYAVHVRLSGEQYHGMMNIGVRPTFGERQHTIEVHIFNFDQDIYGETLRIECVEKIRNEIHFSNPGELVKQLEKDKTHCVTLLREQEA
ncbi:MAG: bifunctional riboflavin kinase/FAD synthetase [bacterium]